MLTITDGAFAAADAGGRGARPPSAAAAPGPSRPLTAGGATQVSQQASGGDEGDGWHPRGTGLLLPVRDVDGFFENRRPRGASLRRHGSDTGEGHGCPGILSWVGQEQKRARRTTWLILLFRCSEAGSRSRAAGRPRRRYALASCTSPGPKAREAPS
eukprot:scaffold115_cov304-Prasinococcus_capsulatus_cf.AAC.54